MLILRKTKEHAKRASVVPIKKNLRQIKYFIQVTHCITPKHITSFRDPSPRHYACSNTASFEKTSQWWRAVDNTVSDLTRPRFEPQASRSKCERVTARPAADFYVLKTNFK